MLICNMVEDIVEGFDLNHSDSSRQGEVGNMDDVDDVGSFLAHGGVRDMTIVRGDWGNTITPHLG